MSENRGPYEDRPLAELIPEIEWLASHGCKVYLKWTCPGCGERVTSDEPNSVHLGGMDHTEKEDGSVCGTRYTGELYGFTLFGGANTFELLKEATLIRAKGEWNDAGDVS